MIQRGNEQQRDEELHKLGLQILEGAAVCLSGLLEPMAAAARQLSDALACCLLNFQILKPAQLTKETYLTTTIDLHTGAVHLSSQRTRAASAVISRQIKHLESVHYHAASVLASPQNLPATQQSRRLACGMSWADSDPAYVIYPTCLEATVASTLILQCGRYIDSITAVSVDSFQTVKHGVQFSADESKGCKLASTDHCTTLSELGFVQFERSMREEYVVPSLQLWWQPISVPALPHKKLNWLILSLEISPLVNSLQRYDLQATPPEHFRLEAVD